MKVGVVTSLIICFSISVFGKNYPDDNLAVILAKEGKQEEAIKYFNKFLASQEKDAVNYRVIRAHSWLATLEGNMGKMEESIKRGYHILSLIDKAGKLGVYPSQASYYNEKVFHIHEIFEQEWSLGRIGRCAKLMDQAQPELKELLKLTDPVKNRPKMLYFMKRRKYAKWKAEKMVFNLLDAGGKQQEAIERLSDVIEEMEQYDKEISLSESNRMELMYFYSLLAEEYSEIGKFEEAIDLKRRSSAVKFKGYKYLNANSSLMELDILFNEAKRDGVLKIDPDAFVTAWSEAEGDGSVTTKISAKRSIAQLLHFAGRSAEALNYIDEAMNMAREHNVYQWMPKTLRIRSYIHMALGNIEKAESDVLEAIEIMRTKATKFSEAYLYQAYARILYRKGNIAEALKVWELGIILCGHFNKPYLHLDILCDMMELHIQQGSKAEAWIIWQRAQKLLKEFPDIQPYWRRRLPKLLAEYKEIKESKVVKTTAHETRTAQAHEDTQSADGAENTEKQRNESGSVVCEGLLLQPAVVETRVQPGESANARFQALNISANSLKADLTVLSDSLSCEWQVVSEDTVVGVLNTDQVDQEQQGKQVLSIPAGQVVNIFMSWKAGNGDAVDEHQSVNLAWAGREEGGSEWVFGTDSLWRNVAVVDSSLVIDSAFLHVPFYHSIYHRGTSDSVIDVQVKTAKSCRIEIYEEGSDQPLALDANGDGDYLDEGDAVFSDANGNQLPDLNFSDAADARTIEVWVFPLKGTEATVSEEIEVMVSAGESGDLQLQAVDKLVPAGAL